MNKQVYLYLLRTYGRMPGYWLGVAAAVAQTVLLRVVSVVIIARLAGDIASGNFTSAKLNALWYLAISLLGLAFRLLRELAAVRSENTAYAKLMVDYYQKLVGKDMAFYRDHQTGYLSTAFRQHVDSTMELVRLFRGEVIQTFISLIVPTVVLFFASWQLGLTALAVVFVQMFYITWSSSKTNKYRAQSHEIYRKISGVVSDDVTNIVAYKTSGAASQAVSRMEKLSDQERVTFWQRRKLLAILDVPREAITIIGVAIAFWLITSNAESTSQSVGLIVLTTSYMFQLFQIIGNVPDIIVRHDDLVTRLYPTMEYNTDKYEEIKDRPKPLKLKVAKAQIDFEHMSFGYMGQDGKKSNIFKDFNLHIRGGQQVGVVGLSGAGKSTLASLLMRFDDVDGGAIKIDGTDIRDVKQAELRQNIAFVPQEPLLFHRTIRENLQYFGKDKSQASMVKAAMAAHAHDFISKLPAGYDTLVGERGIKLSGGQKQRVVIARTILKNAPIMLFDEATSALDSESEKIIQKALPKIIGKRTAIVIAHRLSTVAGLDRIIVMQDGAIIEDGTHNELLRLKGRYYSLWQKQTAQQE